MGVRGLNKFMEENPQIFKPYKLHDTRVVIDGCNLIHYFYQYSGADYMFGGDYNEYANAVRKYFATFFECNIVPIVIFDGGHEPSERALEKSIGRQENRLKNIADLIQKGDCWSLILPINTYEIFKDILSEMGIMYAQCDYEGDKQTATLAKCYECPVLSNDSDFFVYDLPHGFIRFSNMSHRIFTEKEKNGCAIKFLTCQIYYVDSLLANFPLREKSVLSLLAVLAINDYSTYEDFKYFYYKINARSKAKFYTLFAWLRRQTLEQAINQVLRFTLNGKKNDIETMINNSLEDYELKHTNMVNILNGINSNIDKSIVDATKLETLCGKPLPKEFVVAFHKGYIPSTLLNIISVHRNFLSPQIEKFSNSSSHFCSQYIRRIIYGILLSHDPTNSKLHTKHCLKKVEEYDRINDDLLTTKVECLVTLRSGEPVPMLTEIYHMRKEHLRDFISNVLGVNKNFFSNIPDQLQLLFGCINYWLSNCAPKPTKEFLSALLLSILYYQMKETAMQTNTNKNKTVRIKNISQPTAITIVENFKHYIQKPVTNKNRPFDVRIVHYYSQLQTCVFESVSLNLLTNLPFEGPKVCEPLFGSLLYFLTKELEANSNSEVIIRTLLEGDLAAIRIFNAYMNKFVSKLPADYFRSIFRDGSNQTR